jgi:hypothetical protein
VGMGDLTKTSKPAVKAKANKSTNKTINESK